MLKSLLQFVFIIITIRSAKLRSAVLVLLYIVQCVLKCVYISETKKDTNMTWVVSNRKAKINIKQQKKLFFVFLSVNLNPSCCDAVFLAQGLLSLLKLSAVTLITDSKLFGLRIKTPVLIMKNMLYSHFFFQMMLNGI